LKPSIESPTATPGLKLRKGEDGMTKDLLGARSRAEAQFEKTQKTTEVAKGVRTELQTTRKKTTRLRQERLAKEAAEAVPDPDATKKQ
jgi:hypothetical protein